MAGRKNTKWIRVLALLLCAALLSALALPALAEEKKGVVDDAALTEMVEGFLREQGIPTDRVGIGFCFPATGEEWFYNPDTWFYPASMYKVPLMMQLAECVYLGDVAPDTKIKGEGLDTYFNYILVHSNNDYAHNVRDFLNIHFVGAAGDDAWREEVKKYARLTEYDPRYMEYCYFSPRYITQVLETLYADPDRFPGVLDNMLKAEQGHYFRLANEMHVYDIAQKYGSYSDMEGTDWNHNCGIIYTPQPFILTVMTRNVPNYEWVIGHFALLFAEYALSIETEVTEYAAEQQEAEAERIAEEERLEAERIEFERLEAERQEAERQAEIRRAAEDRLKQERASRALMYSLAATGAGLVILGILRLAIIPAERKKKRQEQYRRRFEQELRQEELARRRAANQDRRRP